MGSGSELYGLLPDDDIFGSGRRNGSFLDDFFDHLAGEHVSGSAAGCIALSEQVVADEVAVGTDDGGQPVEGDVCVVIAFEEPVEFFVFQCMAQEGECFLRQVFVAVVDGEGDGVRFGRAGIRGVAHKE